MTYNQYAPIFNQFQNTYAGFQGISSPSWYNVQTPNELAGRIVTLKKGGEKERLKALAQFILQQGSQDPVLKNLAHCLIDRADSLQAPAAATRKKTHKTYKKTKKHASKSHKKTKSHAKTKKHVAKKHKAKHAKKPHAKRPTKKAKKVTHKSKHSKKHTSHYKYKYTFSPPSVSFPHISLHIPPNPVPAHPPTPAFIPAPFEEIAAPSPVTTAFTNSFSNYEINPSHLRHSFTGAALPTIKPLPTANDFNLVHYLEEIITYISPSWPEDFRIKDDGDERAPPQRTKTDLLSLIRTQITALHQNISYKANRENQALLQRMYGNIFFIIRTQIKNIGSLTPKQKNAFDRKVRSFIQSLGITFCHCSDRLMTDSSRYYFQFVENKIHAVEDDESIAIDEKLHRELVQLRRTIFQEAYFAIDTNSHDAATQRYVHHALNDELSLHMPPFNEDDSYASFALREKVSDVTRAFYARYTPARIAQYLNSTLKTAIEEHAQGRARQNWYTLVTAYLTNKHPGIDVATIYDLDNNCFTAGGMALLLSDLNVIKINR